MKNYAHFTGNMDKEKGVKFQMKVSSNSHSGPLKYMKLNCLITRKEIFVIFVQERNATKSHPFGQKNKYFGIK